MTLERRRLGASDLEVTELSLGSWRTYERISREAGGAVMRAAREAGINFLDDARYNDESGHAPLKTGYSEVVFGELFRAAGWKRDEVVVANKLWWEFWPEQSAAQELDGSLRRMGLDHVDLIYAERPPEGMSVEEVVHQVSSLIAAGKARAWGVLNWPARLIADAAPGPCAAQLAYSLVTRSPVEDAEMVRVLEKANFSVVASYSLAGGALSGKYDRAGVAGRVTAGLDKRDYSKALAAGSELNQLAAEVGAKPSALAIAFALLNPAVASVLFGATKPEQVAENVAAAELKQTMDEHTVERLRQIGA